MDIRKCYESNNLFDDLKIFNKRNSLNHVVTKVTTEGGKILNERYENGMYNSEIYRTCHGYVVDTKPDLQIALVIPSLILASQDVAQDFDLLKSNQVTHILNLAYGHPNHYESEFVYMRLDIRDDPQENIQNFFDSCFKFIDRGVKDGCVLVHCNAGVSRSATVVIAYLMKFHEKSLNEAFSIVKRVRPAIKPNDGFMKQLQKYEQYLCHKYNRIQE